jgi:hypothetical protein
MLAESMQDADSQNMAANLPSRLGDLRPTTSLDSNGDQLARTACAFSSVLGETHTRAEGFKELNRRLDTTFPDRRRVEAKLKEGSAGFASLSKALAMDSSMAVLVSGNPTKALSTSEQQKLVDFVVDGGHLVVASSAGGFASSNMNDVLVLFGVSANRDAVIRGSFYKYFHPKEVCISDGAVSRNMVDGVAGIAPTSTREGVLRKGSQSPMLQAVRLRSPTSAALCGSSAKCNDVNVEYECCSVGMQRAEGQNPEAVSEPKLTSRQAQA